MSLRKRELSGLSTISTGTTKMKGCICAKSVAHHFLMQIESMTQALVGRALMMPFMDQLSITKTQITACLALKSFVQIAARTWAMCSMTAQQARQASVFAQILPRFPSGKGSSILEYELLISTLILYGSRYNKRRSSRM